MNSKELFRRLAVILTTIVVIILVAAIASSCKSSKKTPYGSLKDKGNYVSYTYQKNGEDKTIDISYKELYNALIVQRSSFTFQAPALLSEEIKSYVLTPYVEEVTTNLTTTNTVNFDETKTYKEALDEIILNSIYSTSDTEEIEKLPQGSVKTSKQKFADAMYSYGITVDPTASDAEILSNDAIVEYFSEELAKKIYAYGELLKEVADKDSDNYIDSESVTDYFTSNYESRGDVKVLIVRFSSSDEAAAVLRLIAAQYYERAGHVFNGVYQYNNQWYPVTAAEEGSSAEQNKTHYENQTTNFNPIVSSSASSDTYRNQPLSNSEVLYEFVKIYNQMYSYKQIATTGLDLVLYNDEEIFTSTADFEAAHPEASADSYVKFTSFEEVLAAEDLALRCEILCKAVEAQETADIKLSYTYDELNSVGSTIRSYVYNTLSTSAGDSAISGTTYIQYTPSAKSTGNNEYYIAFKLEDSATREISDVVEGEDAFRVKDEDGNEVDATFEDLSRAKAIASKFTDSYIGEKLTSLTNDVKVTIYDPTLELLYSLANDGFKTSKSSSKTNVAKFTLKGYEAKTISVDDFFNELNARYGAVAAMDLITNKMFLNSDYYDQVTKEDRDTFKDNLKVLLENFSANYFSSYGLPASMGRKNFLKVYFKASSNTDAIENFYVPSKISELFYSDYETQASFMGENATEDDLYSILALFTNKNYDLTYTITASKFTVYYDLDEDGKADDPTNADSMNATLNALAVELINAIYDEVENNTDSHATTLSSVIDQYNTAIRLDPNEVYGGDNICSTDKSSDVQDSCKWAKYKLAGLKISTSDVGSVTNSTLVTPNTYSTELTTRLNELIKTYTLNTENYGDQLLDTLGATNENIIADADGYSVVYVTAQTLNTSFKYSYTEDTEGNFANLGAYFNENFDEISEDEKAIYGIYNENDHVTANQIKVYMKESSWSDGVESLPDSLITVMDTYFKSISSTYTGSSHKMMLLYEYLKTQGNMNFTSAETETQYLEMMAITVRSLDSYAYFTADSDKNPYYGWANTFTPLLAHDLGLTETRLFN